jgi:SAM-dependent methyltransferase
MKLKREPESKIYSLLKKIAFHCKTLDAFLRFCRRTILKIYSFLFIPRVVFYDQIVCKFKGRMGIEIGGPSKIFMKNKYIPLYNVASKIDNIQFSSKTIWQRDIVPGLFFLDGKLLGNQYILEASDLSKISSSQYDFLLSSEMIQHVANPLKALFEWKRVLKPGGFLLLIIPDKNSTFDHRREVTKLIHLIEDYEANIEEDDLTHLPEVLTFHDLSRDYEAGGYDNFKIRCERNFAIRGMHHHCFDLNLSVKLLEKANFKTINSTISEHRIIILAESI